MDTMDTLTHPIIKIGSVYRYSNADYVYDFEVVGFFKHNGAPAKMNAVLKPLGDAPDWLLDGGNTYELCDNLTGSLSYTLLAQGDIYSIET